MTNSIISATTKSKLAAASWTTKKDQLIKLLGSKSGADIKSLSEKLGWQRAASGASLCVLVRTPVHDHTPCVWRGVYCGRNDR